MSQTITVSPGPQVVTFTSNPSPTAQVGDLYNPTATAPGGAVTFTSDTPIVCTYVNPTVTLLTAGTCTVRGDVGASANYLAGTGTQSFLVGGSPQTVTITSPVPTNPTYLGGSTYNVVASASSGLPVTISAAPTNVCTASGTTVSYTGAGSCTVTASQSGNATFNAATPATQTFTVLPAAQTITLVSSVPAAAVVDGATYIASATAPGGAVTYSSGNTTVCTASGATFAFVGVGTCVVNFNQAGGGNYAAAPQRQQSFAVGKGTQAVTVTSAQPASPVVFQTYTATATAAGGAVTFSTGSPAVCTVSGSVFSFVASGTCIVQANQAGSTNYLPGQGTQSFFVATAAQSISFQTPTPTGVVYQGTPYTPTATATSGLAVSIVAGPASVCVKPATTVTFVGLGACAGEQFSQLCVARLNVTQ